MHSVILVLAVHAATAAPTQLAAPFDDCECPCADVLLQTSAAARLPVLRRPDSSTVRMDVVLRWNETVLDAIRTEGTAPPLAARNLALVHAAIFDAVNAITQTHRSYYVHVAANAGQAPEAAAAVAAHRTLTALYPRQVQRFDAALDASLESIPEGPSKTDGIQLGNYVAEKFLAWRSRDDAAAQVSDAPAPGPGVWRPTPPQFLPPLLPQWRTAPCFCMRSGAQFRAAGPPPLGSDAYWASYREVKSLGGVHSSLRTAEQTTIAKFWKGGEHTVTPPGQWNQIAQIVARQRGTTLAENARLFALLNLTLADAGIMAWDCKYAFYYWRPIQAIRNTTVTNDPTTSGDPDWASLLDSPPFPSYSSGHSSFSGAAARVLANFFGTDAVAFTLASDDLPGVRRSFHGFSQAADEAGRSRIYGGIHWQFDNADGLATGRALGDFVTENFLTPRTIVTLGRPTR